MPVLTADLRTSGAESWALRLGVWYLVLIVFNQYVVFALLGRSNVTLAEMRRHAGVIVLTLAATRLTSIVAMVLLLANRRGTSIRAALRGPSFKRLSSVIGLSIVLTLLLNAWGIWPFVWRWQLDSNVQLVRTLTDGGHVLLLILWLIILPVGIALIEEIVFRYGLLGLLARHFRSSRFAIMGSAVLFGAVHLGYPPWKPDTPHLWQSAAATAFGVAMGVIAVRARGRIAVPVAIHATVNVVGTLALLAVALGW